MFEESGDFDGALREKASAPRIPPRRRRGQNQTEDTSEVQEDGAVAQPAVKKNAGWSDEAAPPSGAGGLGRRAGAATEGETPTAAIEVSSAPAAEKFEDLLEIPDLEESDQSEQPSVAEPGFVETVALPTDLSLDEGALPPAQVQDTGFSCGQRRQQLTILVSGGRDRSWASVRVSPSPKASSLRRGQLGSGHDVQSAQAGHAGGERCAGALRARRYGRLDIRASGLHCRGAYTSRYGPLMAPCHGYRRSCLARDRVALRNGSCRCARCRARRASPFPYPPVLYGLRRTA